jgi:hypothetical protein
VTPADRAPKLRESLPSLAMVMVTSSDRHSPSATPVAAPNRPRVIAAIPAVISATFPNVL